MSSHFRRGGAPWPVAQLRPRMDHIVSCTRASREAFGARAVHTLLQILHKRNPTRGRPAYKSEVPVGATPGGENGGDNGGSGRWRPLLGYPSRELVHALGQLRRARERLPRIHHARVSHSGRPSPQRARPPPLPPLTHLLGRGHVLEDPRVSDVPNLVAAHRAAVVARGPLRDAVVAERVCARQRRVDLLGHANVAVVDLFGRPAQRVGARPAGCASTPRARTGIQR